MSAWRRGTTRGKLSSASRGEGRNRETIARWEDQRFTNKSRNDQEGTDSTPASSMCLGRRGKKERTSETPAMLKLVPKCALVAMTRREIGVKHRHL